MNCTPRAEHELLTNRGATDVEVAILHAELLVAVSVVLDEEGGNERRVEDLKKVQ